MNINKSIVFIKNILTKMVLIAYVFQLYLDASFVNVISSTLAVLTSLLMFSVVLNNKIKSLPDSFLATIVFVTIFSNSTMPLLATCLEQKALVYRLLLPIEVYAMRLIYAIIVLSAYALLVRKKYKKNSFFIKLSSTLKISSQLSYKQVWLWGFIGIFFFFAQGFAGSGALSKFIAGFKFLLWTPFVLVIPPYYTITKRKKHFKYLLVYFLFMIILAAITNSRMGFVGPLMVIGFGVLVSVFSGSVELVEFVKKNTSIIIFSGILLFAFFSFLARLSDSIQYSRKFRGDVSTSELMYLTYINFFNEDASVDTRSKNISHNFQWSEDYIDNPFIARFVNIKFDDNCLVRIHRFTEDDMRLLKEMNNNKLLALLPSPILNTFGLSVDKLFVNSFSTGDYIDYLANGSQLQGKKTGSLLVHTYALFGYWSIITLFLLVYFSFRLYSVILNKKEGANNSIVIPTFALIMPWFFYLSTNPESYTNFMAFFLRSSIQTLILYGLMTKLTKVK